MSALEFSRPFDLRQGDGPLPHMSANETERSALASRFGLVSIRKLGADLTITRQGDAILATGRMEADIVQSCAVSGDDLPMKISEELKLRFVPVRQFSPDEELELDAQDCDEIEFEGQSFDLGEAIAQSLALAIDPFAIGPNAEQARQTAGLIDESETGPFAALAALKKKD